MLTENRIEYIFEHCISSVECEHEFNTEDNTFDYEYGSTSGVHGSIEHSIDGTVTIEFENVTTDELQQLTEQEKDYLLEIGNDEQSSSETKVKFDNNFEVENKTIKLNYSVSINPKDFWY